MAPRLARARWIIAAISLPVVLGTCTEGGTGPAHRVALSVTTTMPSSAELQSFNLVIDNVRLIVVRPPSDTLFNAVFSFPADQTELPLQANVDLESDQENLEVTIQLLSGTQVLFSGTQTVTVGTSPSPPQVNIPVSYNGPGQNVATLTVDPPDSVLSFGAGLTLRATARDGQGVIVPNVYLGWSTSDATLAPIDANGHLVAPLQRTSVTVTVAVPNGVTGSTPLTFVPVATAINIVSGCGQFGSPGAQLLQPIVVRVIAGDGLGVKGITVQFTAPVGGSVATPTAVTDDNGLAQTLATLPQSGSADFSIGATGLSPVTCNQTILGGTATHLVFTVQPSSIIAGNAFLVTVTAADALGATVTSFNGLVTLTIGANPGGISFGTANSTAVAGVATFAGLSITTAASGYTLVANSVGLTGVTSAPFNVIPAASSQLAFTVQPGGQTVTVGVPITPAVVVVVQDQFGNITPTANSITMAIGNNPGGATLGGTLTQAAVAGVAAFTLTLDQAGTGYTLIASSSGLASATSAAFNVVPLTGLHLVFTTQPSNVTAGSLMAPPVVVTVQDAQNNPATSFTGTVSLSLGNCGTATLLGTTTVAAAAGVATFADLRVDRTGPCILVTSSSGLQSVVSANFTVAPGAAAQLAFTVQPSNVAAGAVISPIVRVEIQDTLGNTVVTAIDNVTLAIGANPGNAVLGGTTTKAAAAGVALFTNLTLDKAGTGYTLVATSGSLVQATSATFNVTGGSVTHFAIVAPPSVTAGVPATITVTAQDASNNTVTSYVGAVAFTSSDLQATLPAPYTFVAGDNGTHTFTNGATLKTQGSQSISATDVVTPSITGSASVTVSAASASVLAFTVQPGSILAGANFTPPVLVTARDVFGNTTATFAGNVTLSIANNPSNGSLLGTGTVTAAAGVASFASVSVNNAGVGYTLSASATGLSSATSVSFTVTAGAATQLGFFTGPSTVVQGVSISPAVQVAVEDQFGNTVTTATTLVSMTIGTNPGSAALGGTTTKAAIGGIASFSDLTLSAPGTGYTLVASASGLGTVGSNPFDVLSGAAGISWSNPAGGNWSVPSNWSPARVPGKADTVFITLPGTYTVTLDVNDTIAFLTLGGATGTQTLTATNRTFGIDTAASILANGVVNLTTTTINGDGTLSTLGSLFIAPGSSVIHAAVGVGPAGLLRLNGNNGFADLGVIGGLTNAGTVHLTGTSWAGRLTVAGGSFTNSATGLLQSTASVGNSFTGVLDNQGAVQVDGPLTFNGVSAVHQNSGTITLGAGNLTIAQSGSTPSFTTSGTVLVGSGRTLQVNGGAFNYANAAPGGLAGLGTITFSVVTLDLTPDFTQDTLSLVFSNSTVNGTGTLHVASSRALTLTGTTLNVPLDNAGTVFATFGTNVLNAALTNQAGAMLQLNGNNGFADMTVASGFTNAGTIQLTGTSWSGRLTVGGTLVNGSTGILQSVASVGNVLTAVLDNQGGVQVDGPLTLNAASADHLNSGTITLGTGNLTLNQSGTTPSFTTTGSVVVGSGRTLQVNGGAFNYANASPGGLAGLGTVSFSSVTVGLNPDFTQDTLSWALSNSTVNGAGTVHVAATRTLTLTGTTLNVALDNLGAVQATFGTNVFNGAVTNQAGALLRLNGNNGFADVTVASGFTNAGTIVLTGTSWSGRLTVTSGFLVNGATGSLQSIASVGNVLTAPLNNQGSVLVDGPLTLNAVSADHANSGTITLGAGNLTVSQSGTTPTFTTSNDVIIGTGRTWTVNGGAVNYTAGKIEGNGVMALNGVTLGLGLGLVHDTLQVALNTVIVNGPGTLTVAPGASLTLTNTTFNTGFTNQGTTVAAPGVNTFNAAVTNPSGALFQLNGNNGFADVTLANGFTNAGTIELTGTSWAGRLTVGSPTVAAFANAPGSTLKVTAGTGNTVTAILNNQGTILVNGPLTLSGASADHFNSGTITLGAGDLTLSQTGTTPSFTTTGSIVVGSGRVFQVNGGAFNYSNSVPGGLAGLGTVNFSGVVITLTPNVTQDTLTIVPTSSVINGPGSITVVMGRTLTLTGCTLNNTLANFGTVQAAFGTNTLNGPFSNQAGAMFRLNGNNGFADVTVASGFTNNGTIELTGTSWAGRLTVGTPAIATLVNASSGLIHTVAGAGNVLTGELNNQGMVQVDGPFTMLGAAAGHVNSGFIKLGSSDMTVTESGFRPGFSNFGTIDVGTRKLVVNGTGDFINQSGGIYRGTGTFDIGTPNISFITDGRTIVDGSPGGRLNWIGAFTIGPPGSLELNVAGLGSNPGTDYDQLTVSDNVTIQTGTSLLVTGTLVPGELYVVIQVPVGKTISGDFQTKNGLGQCSSGVSGTAYLIAC